LFFVVETSLLFNLLVKYRQENPTMSDVLAEFARETIDRMLKDIPLEKRLEGLAPEQRLEGLSPEQRLAGLAPEQRLAGLAPEQRLAGLSPEDREAILRVLISGKESARSD
jgi:hypothetical protein